MSAKRETNHHMTIDGLTVHDPGDADRTPCDIAPLLAHAADGVEIGTAPYAAVLRGGRRRRARRWAAATATALALVATAGTLAVAGLPAGDGSGDTSVATNPAPPPTPPGPDVRTPSRTLLASGTDHGKRWRVLVDLWEAPRTERQAAAELAAMRSFGQRPANVADAADLVGRSTYFVLREYGEADTARVVSEGAFTDKAGSSGEDIEAVAMPLVPGAKDAEGAERLVVGRVALDARKVTCTWKDGTTTEVPSFFEAAGGATPTKGVDMGSETPLIRVVDGSPAAWFACVAPEGTAFESVAVTK
ncbi:hypothetical protein ACFV46_19395 [Streptomyces sp. NPDC059852]|uniref:hypothetical protein n=1 Tax=Streptomyces sp. NPDC059852 TaxID=3346972 RepID=UPI00365845CA